MKQTAVEWFVEQLAAIRKQNSGYRNIEIELKELIEQAKAMEKEQIVKTFTNVTVATLQNLNIKSTIQDILDFKKIAEVYYNETFKSE